MKIGIYGGSFNPFHLGHEQIALKSIEILSLDKLIIVPVGLPSHRDNNLEDSNIRYDIIKTVFENENKIIVSDIEINSKKISYTYDTLIKIKNKYGFENKYYEIIGEDSLSNFHNWKDYEKILNESTVCVVKRRGSKSIFNDKRILYLDIPYIDISASDIRYRIKNNMDISKLVNKKVLDTILNEMKDNV